MLRQSPPQTAAAALLLLLIVALGPLPFGSVLVRDRSFLDVCALLALAFALSGDASSPAPRAYGKNPGPVWVAVLMAAVGVFGLLQSLPWPSPLVQTLAPGLAHGWKNLDLLEGAPGFLPLSIAPDVSRTTGFHWLAVAAGFGTAFLVGRWRLYRRWILFALIAVAIFEVLYGTGTWLDSPGRIWNREVGGDIHRLRGTFVNANHTALFLSMALTVTFAGQWWATRRARYTNVHERKLFFWFSPALVFLVLFVGLAFTGSRAGFVAVVLALLTQTILLTLRERRARSALLALGVLTFGLGGVAWFSLEKGYGRLLSTSTYEVAWNSRFSAWRASWDLFLGSPLSGTGLGTFRQAFPTVQPSRLEGTWSHLHNDILELLTTTGVLGFALMALALPLTLKALHLVFRRGRRSEDRALGLAGLGALIGAFFHSTLDFGLTIPANAFALAILLGLACGSPLSTPESD